MHLVNCQTSNSGLYSPTVCLLVSQKTDNGQHIFFQLARQPKCSLLRTGLAGVTEKPYITTPYSPEVPGVPEHPTGVWWPPGPRLPVETLTVLKGLTALVERSWLWATSFK